MCGRFVSSSSSDKIAEYFGAAQPVVAAEPLSPSFNVAPTNDVYAITANVAGERAVEIFRWGLVPSWAKDAKIGSKMINARGETIATKPAFKAPLKKHRLLVPMDGFYEWQAVAGGGEAKATKQPMFIHRADGQQLAVAGLWAAWRDRSDEAPADAPWLHSCTVITTAANDTMRPVHDRMPVILPRSMWDDWLNPSFQDVDALVGMLRAAPNDLLTMHPVSTAVNSVRNKGAELIERIDPASERLF